MKRISTLFLLASLGLAAGAVQAAQPDPGLTGCAAKRSAIENQLKIARDHGNSDQVAGWRKHCVAWTTAPTRACAKSVSRRCWMHVTKWRSAKKRPEESREKKGDAEKINKRKDKLAESRKELQEAVDDLDR